MPRIRWRSNSRGRRVLAVMTTNELYAGLVDPVSCMSASEFANQFSCHQFDFHLKGLGVLFASPALLVKGRGAFGQVLLQGASEAVQRGRPCDWTPCCASEVFFAPKPRVSLTPETGDSNQIAKPFVLSAHRHGQQDLIIRLTIFGAATHWSQVASQAMATALRHRIDWQLLSEGHYFVPRQTELASVKQRQKSATPAQEGTEECVLSFQTPVDSERSSLVDHPEKLIEKLLIRVASMARWYGVKLTDNIAELRADARNLVYTFDSPPLVNRIRIDAGRSEQHGFREAALLDLRIAGDLHAFLPFLRLGEVMHVGRGAVKGQGRFALHLN